MPPYVVLASLAVCLSVPLLWFSVAPDRGRTTRKVSRNLSAGMAGGGDLRGMVLSQSPAERLFRPATKALAAGARRLSPTGVVDNLERRIQLAGVGWKLETVLALKLVMGAGPIVVGVAWAWLGGPGTATTIGLVGGFIGFLLPDSVLARLAAARQVAIGNQLPDTLDQLTICVESGLGIDAALARIARTATGPLGGEIARLLQDLRVGVPRADALNDLLERTDVAELRQFVHALLQAESFGVPVSRVLRAQAVEQREKRRFRAEERAMKLPVKVIFPLVFCILPVLFIVVLGPAFVRLSSGL